MNGNDDKRFWDIIAVGCPREVDPDEWSATLALVLAKLPPEDIARFDYWMDVQTDRAYHRDLWQAAALINSGASDDGFYYFRLWLLGMGKVVFEAALINPDSLADVVDPHREYEADMYGTPHDAWALATGNERFAERDDYLPLYEAAKREANTPRQQPPVLQGEEWPTRDASAYQRRFPRLEALYRGDFGEYE